VYTYINMFKITALSKYKDLNGSPRLYYVLGVSSFLSIVSFLFYKNFFITVVLLASGVVSYIVLSRKPKPILIEMDEAALYFDGAKTKWDSCIGWAMVDLGDTTEIIVQTTDVSQQFLYFYFKENQPGIKEFILYITNNIPYLPKIQEKNVVHRFLRTLDLI
jgi:hypothetical protein